MSAETTTTNGDATYQLDSGLLRIGRDPSNDVVVGDLLVSRHHAEVRAVGDGGYMVVDRRSRHGTFVNGQRVTRAKLEDFDMIMIGHHTFRLIEGKLEESVDSGEVAYAAVDLNVRLRNQESVLDRISFSLEPCSLLGIIGPSGCGKSTLMNALSGHRFATEGEVVYDGQSLYSNYHALRPRIGLVPQDDIVHTGLSVREALEYTADLRFPADVSEEERDRRAQEVTEELDLSHRSDVPINHLSGGQRKRVSVALELLSRPSLLLLDEPTSGLDPHFEHSLMEVLRKLADGGRTVVVVTHSVQSLQMCDRIAVLAPGGSLAYFGPPQLATTYFERPNYARIYEDLTEAQTTDWGGRFRAHPYYRDYVQRDVTRERLPRAAPPAPPRNGRLVKSTHGWWRQFTTLTRRYVSVLASDRRNVALMILQAPVLGLLMLAALPAGELAVAPVGVFRIVSQAGLVLLVVTLGVTWLGMSNAAREIAKELPIYRRERPAGLSISAYIASKAVVLGAITAIQSAVLVALAVAAQHGPKYGAFSSWPIGELILAGILAGLAAMALGLLISSLSKTDDQATTVLPVVVFVELILALGGVFPQIGNKPVLHQLGYLSSARWGFAAAASTADFNNLQSVSGTLTHVPSVKLSNPEPFFARFSHGDRGDSLWDHTPSAWTLDAGVLVALTAAALIAAGLALRRYDGGRRVT